MLEDGLTTHKLPPRSRRLLFWWLVNGAWLLFLSGIAIRHEIGAGGMLISAFGIYGMLIFGGFVLHPHAIPPWLEFLCFGNMEAEYYALLWPGTVELNPETTDRTWRWPAVAALIEGLGFAGFF